MLTIDLVQDFPQPRAAVFQDFHDHEEFGRILGVPMKHLVDGAGEGGRHGVGSVRRIGPPGPLRSVGKSSAFSEETPGAKSPIRRGHTDLF